MSRLPPIMIEGRPCALPLAEPTATVLLLALIGGDETGAPAQECESGDGAHAALATALALDPALALWAAFHHASASGSADSDAPSLITLTVSLARRLREILSAAPAGTAESHAEERPRNAQGLAKLAATAVLSAQQSSHAEPSNSDPQYLAALLADAGAWLAQGGLDANAVNALPGWLGQVHLIAPAVPAGSRKAVKKTGPTAASSSRAGGPTVPQRAQAKAAADRWLVPAGLASRQFATLAARLTRLADLEANFAERLLEEKLHALGEFAAGAGHEINNPLAVISGRAQLFLRHEVDPERRRELAVINTQARRVHEMIADLMLFARPPQPRPAPCDAAFLVSAVIAELAPRAAERSIALRSTITADPLLPISADAMQVQVALRAVIENALDAAPAGGAVEVTIDLRDSALHNASLADSSPGNAKAEIVAGRSESRVSVGRITAGQLLAITVRDDGPGIDASGRRNLFDPFYSGRGAGRGIGMGLSKCWRIVTAHGGRVEIENQASGGACVTILLPLAVG